MACPLHIPRGTTFNHNGVRIKYIEALNDFVLRFSEEETGGEYFVDIDGTRVRLTVKSFLDEFANERLHDLSVSEKTLSEWGGRYHGLDREAVLAAEPRAVLKFDIALAAIMKGLPRSANLLQQFASDFVPPDGDPPSGRSVIRWMNTLQDNDLRIGSLKNRSGRQKGTSPLPPNADRLVQQSAALYWSNEWFKKMDSYALVVNAWERHKELGLKGIGSKPPSKTTVVNRINACENKATYGLKFGRHEADRHFLASGVSVPVTRPFQLAYMDGTEYEQICHFSADVRVPSAKMKSVWIIDAASLFVFPSTPFAGPYRGEMGMAALHGALTPPVLDEQTTDADPLRALMFGRLGRLRTDNDKAILPPSAIGNLANVVTRVELAKKYGPNEKAIIENFNGFMLRRLDGLPGTVLSARSRRKSIRRDPIGEATMTRGDFCRRVEELRLEWNDTGHRALGGRTPNDVMQEEVLERKARFTSPGEVRRQLARTVSGVLTKDGVVYDNIRYTWNRGGMTEVLSANIAAQPFAKRLEGTARCDVSLRVYDWCLDFIEIMNESSHEFVKLWSDDPDYTEFLTRYEHRFHQENATSGATGAQTGQSGAARRAKGLLKAWSDLRSDSYSVAKRAAAVLELDEVRTRARNIETDPDLANLSHLLIDTQVGGRDRVDVPAGPSLRRGKGRTATPSPPLVVAAPDADLPSLEPAPRSNLQMLELEEEEDLDGGIDWDDLSLSEEADELEPGDRG